RHARRTRHGAGAAGTVRGSRALGSQGGGPAERASAYPGHRGLQPGIGRLTAGSTRLRRRREEDIAAVQRGGLPLCLSLRSVGTVALQKRGRSGGNGLSIVGGRAGAGSKQAQK